MTTKEAIDDWIENNAADLDLAISTDIEAVVDEDMHQDDKNTLKRMIFISIRQWVEETSGGTR